MDEGTLNTLFRAELAIESTSLSLSEIIYSLGCDPDQGVDIGSFNSHRPDVPWGRSIWISTLHWNQDLHPGTEGLSRAIERLSDELADRAARLVEKGCEVTVCVVQDIDPENAVTSGFHLSASALRWLTRANAELDVDQYVVKSPEG